MQWHILKVVQLAYLRACLAQARLRRGPHCFGVTRISENALPSGIVKRLMTEVEAATAFEQSQQKGETFAFAVEAGREDAAVTTCDCTQIGKELSHRRSGFVSGDLLDPSADAGHMVRTIPLRIDAQHQANIFPFHCDSSFAPVRRDFHLGVTRKSLDFFFVGWPREKKHRHVLSGFRPVLGARIQSCGDRFEQLQREFPSTRGR
jgi:hypothetical protein